MKEFAIWYFKFGWIFAFFILLGLGMLIGRTKQPVKYGIIAFIIYLFIMMILVFIRYKG